MRYACSTPACDAHNGEGRPRFLSENECHELANRLAGMAHGGGDTIVRIVSTWRGTVRWARNQISTAGEVSDNDILVTRMMNGATASVAINDTTDTVLIAAARQAERLAMLQREVPQRVDFMTKMPPEPDMTRPQLFSEATYQLNADQRAATATALARTAADAGLLSAGDIEVLARSMATLDTRGRTLYFQYTHAQYHVTVRDVQGTGSGWAGLDHHDWSKINGAQLTAIALEKCRASQHPVRVEPGRYTTILEPQAVGDFVGPLFGSPDIWGGEDPMKLDSNLYDGSLGLGPFNKVLKPVPFTRLGEQVIDERITVSADPMDPEAGFAPFALRGGLIDVFTVPVYHPVTWIDKGVLTHLAYSRADAIIKGKNLGLPNSGAFRMSGGTTSVDEMIATTKRGILVTRFDQLLMLDFPSQLYRGFTRDGLWLIENGKITHPIKNLAFTESILFALNNVEQLGVPQRVFWGEPPILFSGPQPRIVPALKIRDFSFTALTDAV